MWKWHALLLIAIVCKKCWGDQFLWTDNHGSLYLPLSSSTNDCGFVGVSRFKFSSCNGFATAILSFSERVTWPEMGGWRPRYASSSLSTVLGSIDWPIISTIWSVLLSVSENVSADGQNRSGITSIVSSTDGQLSLSRAPDRWRISVRMLRLTGSGLPASSGRMFCLNTGGVWYRHVIPDVTHKFLLPFQVTERCYLYLK